MLMASPVQSRKGSREIPDLARFFALRISIVSSFFLDDPAIITGQPWIAKKNLLKRRDQDGFILP